MVGASLRRIPLRLQDIWSPEVLGLFRALRIPKSHRASGTLGLRTGQNTLPEPVQRQEHHRDPERAWTPLLDPWTKSLDPKPRAALHAGPNSKPTWILNPGLHRHRRSTAKVHSRIPAVHAADTCLYIYRCICWHTSFYLYIHVSICAYLLICASPLSMYIVLCMHVFYMHTYRCAHFYVYTRMCLYIYIHAHIYLHTYMYIRTYTYTYKHLCIYVYLNIFLHVCIHIYVCPYIHVFVYSQGNFREI